MLDRLEHSFTLQKNFVNNVSHELKNPLAAILGETEITLSKVRTSNEYITALSKILSEAERLDQLTRNLLSLAQTDFEISDLNKEEINIDEILWEVKNYFDKTNHKGCMEINFQSLPESSELLMIKGNSGFLKIALINLIDNACKFSENQNVLAVLQTETNNIHLQIKDQGIGIPEADIPNLFEPFFRASNALSYKGSGIGLSLVNRIVTMHGGSIKFSSEVGKGTTVDLNFPINIK
jgi:signal transduction histidine kinase